MKKIFVLLCLFIFTACNNSNINVNLDYLFSSIDTISKYTANNTLKFYSYYLPSDVGEEEVNSDSITLKYGESTIIMNLNIADIINNKYYSDSLVDDEGFYNKDNLIYEKTGTYKVSDNLSKKYLYKLYDYDEYYALYLKTNDNIFYGNVAKGEVKEVTRQLLIITKSIEVNDELVISTYSSKDTIDYQKKQIDLFNYSMPTSGTLSEMLTDDATVGNQETDNTNSEDTETSN